MKEKGESFMSKTFLRRLFMLALCACLVLLAVLPAGADFGDYSGDSDYGSSSDWSSSDSDWDWSSSDSETVSVDESGTIKTLNLEDALWTEGRPALPETPAWLLSKEYAGFAPAEKLEQLRAKLKELGCTAQLVGKLDNLAWLLNLRAMDIQCTPYAMAYCYVTGDRAVLFINTRRLGAEAAAELKENARAIQSDKKFLALAGVKG